MSNIKLFNETLRGESTQKYLADVLGERKGSFMNNLTALVNNNVSLQACKPLELIYGAMKATALDLPFDNNLGFAYLIPYKDNKSGETHAQFQIGYKGFVQLAIRSGQFQYLNVIDIHEGEIKGKDLKKGTLIIEEAENRDDLPVVGYLAYMELNNGFKHEHYMTIAQLEKHASQYSQTYKSSYTRARSKWATDFDAMARKTCLKLLLSKYAPMSVEMPQLSSAIQADQSVVTATGYEYLDNGEGGKMEADAAEAEARAEAKALEVAKKVADTKAKIKRARAEAMKAATAGVPEDELGGAPAPTIEDMPADDNELNLEY